MDGASGRNRDGMRKRPQQPLPNLARAPVGLLAFGRHNRRLDLLGELIGVAERPARSVGQTFQATFFITLEDLVAGFPGDVELPAQRGHTLPVLEPDHETHALVSHSTFPPWPLS